MTDVGEFASQGIAAVSAAIDEGRLLPSALTERCLSLAERQDGRVRAFITRMPESARAEAMAADERARTGRRLGPLDGIPLAVKDVLATAGVRTTAGSRVLADFVPEDDCPVVRRLREVGAVIVGKTNMHEFAYGVTSDNPYYGAVANPAYPDRIAGGSSGGSAAAVAGGMALGAIGTDTGGSIRIPAAVCGLWGLKPTHGLLPAEGVIPQAWSLDHVGPMARSPEDLRLMIAPWLQDSGAHDSKVLAVPADLLDSADADTRRAFDRFVRRIAPVVTLREISLPDRAAAHAAWLTILLAESAAYHAATLRQAPGTIGADIRPFLLAGSLIGAERYLAAQRFRGEWVRRLRDALDGADGFLHPTLPGAPPQQGASGMRINGQMVPLREALVRFQWPANLSGWPALSFPMEPAGKDGPPFSVMLTGRPLSEHGLLTIARRLAVED